VDDDRRRQAVPILSVLAFLATVLGVWLIIAGQPLWGAVLLAFQIGFVLTAAKRLRNGETTGRSQRDRDPTP
jgi:hypothetical protein